MVKRIFKTEVEDFTISTISCQEGFSPEHDYLEFEVAVFKGGLLSNEKHNQM